jgi:uncharacterized protein
MVALIFFSLGGTLPFLKGKRPPRRRWLLLIFLTLAGSLLGALLLLVVPSKAIAFESDTGGHRRSHDRGGNLR